MVVLPSVTRAEAFGLVLIEGMAAGCVPVASDLPGVRDIAGPTGLVVPAGDAGALRAALRGLALDTARLERLQAASRLAAQALTWDRCVASYEGVLLEAVCSRYARLHGLHDLAGAGRARTPLVGDPGARRRPARVGPCRPVSVIRCRYVPEMSASTAEPGR